MAAGYDSLSPGIYQINASLSCYINAMGGVEFGAPLLESAQVEIRADGSKWMTLYLGKSNVTIYGVSCDTFIDISPSYVMDTYGVKSGTLGFYDKNGVLNTQDSSYTLSDDTAENAQQEQVHYVDSFTFPIEYESDTYEISVFVNSNVMGRQFTKDGYAASLTVDWASVLSGEIVSEEPIDENTENLNKGNVENKEGLHIYHTDKEEAHDTSVETTSSGGGGTYIAYFKMPVLFGVTVVAGGMILLGVVLVILGRKEIKT